MGQLESDQTILDVFAKVDKYVAAVAAVISAVTFANGNKLISYAFVVIVCILLNTWLIRNIKAKNSTGIISERGEPTLRFRYTSPQRYAMIAAAVIISLAAIAWIGFNLSADPSKQPILPTSTDELQTAADVEDTPSDKIVEMVEVPAGTFTMGSPPEQALEDAPEKTINLKMFWIDKYEVTNQQYQDFVKSGHTAPLDWEGDQYPAGMGEYPVINVSWDDARSYCEFVGKRLPMEAEWEKAARGTDGRLWPWGNQWDSQFANSSEENQYASLQPARSYAEVETPYGAVNMAGNVWEWVNDWYEADYYEVGLTFNPTGPPIGEFKVVRGGAWTDSADLLHTYYREGDFPPFYYSPVIGFRCACTDCQ
jgi:formylglycine-generating enzyme required for sulfatase activity